jgi:hypothetical protein
MGRHALEATRVKGRAFLSGDRTPRKPKCVRHQRMLAPE